MAIERMVLAGGVLALQFWAAEVGAGCRVEDEKNDASEILKSAEATTTSIHWAATLNDARVEAKKSNKQIFLLFTGEDWCCACKILEKQALNQPEFAKTMSAKFVFVKYVFPAHAIKESEMRQNPKIFEAQVLATRFNVTGFPSIFILNADGERRARISYPGDAGLFSERLIDLNSRSKNIEREVVEASKITDASARTEKFVSIIKDSQDDYFKDGLRDVVRLAINADSEGRFKDREKYEFKYWIEESAEALSAWDKTRASSAIERLSALSNLTNEQKQKILIQKARLLCLLENRDQALKVLEAAEQLDEKSSFITQNIKWIREDVKRGIIVFGTQDEVR